MVKLDNEWYNLDVTWDEPIFNKNGSNNSLDKVNHTYFNIPDNIFHKDHKRGNYENDEYAKCTATKYSYENIDTSQFVSYGK